MKTPPVAGTAGGAQRTDNAEATAGCHHLQELALTFEEHVIGVLIDRGGGYLHGSPDIVRLRHDLARLRVSDLRDERCILVLAALRALTIAGTAPTIERVATEAAIPIPHLTGILDEVWHGAIVNLEVLEDMIFDIRRRIDLDLLARVLAQIAIDAEARDIEAVATAAIPFIQVVRRVHLSERQERHDQDSRVAHQAGFGAARTVAEASGGPSLTIEVE